MTVAAWWLLVAVVPVLLMGEFLVRRVELLRRFSIPVPVVGGLLVAILLLAANLAMSSGGSGSPAPGATAATAPAAAPAASALSIQTRVEAKWWMWLTTPEVTLSTRANVPLTEPLVVAFFTCIGLNASWLLARKGGLPLIWFLVISAVLCVMQNVVGVLLAKGMDVNPLMGVLCGGVALTGGPGTAMGMAPTFIEAGFADAKVVGLSAATFGLVAGSLLGGPLATLLIKMRGIVTPFSSRGGAGGLLPPTVEGEAASALKGELPGETAAERDATATAAGDGEGFGLAPSGFLAEVWGLGRFGASLLWHVLLIAVCLKVGSYVSYYAGELKVGDQKLTFPVYMGAMVVGILIRNLIDLVRPGKESLIKTDVVEGLASVLLAVFLAMTMVALNLMDLRSVAGPMAVLLVAQVLLMAAFAAFITFPLMGRTYDAAVLTAGQVGFGLGATSNAVATMEATTRRYGPSPKSFLIVTITGGFLIDVVNMFVTMGFLHYLR